VSTRISPRLPSFARPTVAGFPLAVVGGAVVPPLPPQALIATAVSRTVAVAARDPMGVLLCRMALTVDTG
jgi:hypothetical protein